MYVKVNHSSGLRVLQLLSCLWISPHGRLLLSWEGIISEINNKFAFNLNHAKLLQRCCLRGERQLEMSVMRPLLRLMKTSVAHCSCTLADKTKLELFSALLYSIAGRLSSPQIHGEGNLRYNSEELPHVWVGIWGEKNKQQPPPWWNTNH